ncbi:MAG: CotH kinase family protein [Clostridia bacterium]|nr:CotH kinase family protein [Clostridia bacterium]
MDKKTKTTIAILVGVAGLLLAVMVCALCILLIPAPDPIPEWGEQTQVPTGPDPSTVVRSPAITGEEPYGKVAVGRRKSKELIGDLFADGHAIACDRDSSTFYLSVSDDTIGNYLGVAFSVVGSKGEEDLSIVFEDEIDKHSYFQVPNNNKTYRLIVYNDTHYQSAMLYVTTMPFVTIETEGGKGIPKDNDVKCTITLRDGNWREHGSAPVTTSEALIHVRGASSSSFPKKAYKINFRESDYETNRDLSLLGLRSDDDYVLDAMYIDPTRMHNKLSTEIWNEMNPENKASDGEYVEVILNGNYVGLYDLIEPIDKKQLDLDDTNGLLIKSFSWEGTYFDKYSGKPTSNVWMGFELKYPKENISFKNWGLFYEILKATANAKEDPDSFIEMTDYLDHENLTDYWLWLTIFSLRDNRGKNLFWSTPDITDNNAIYLITPWDCDLGFGYRYGKRDTNILDLPHHRDHYENDYIDDFKLLKRYLQMDVNDAKFTVENRWDDLSAEGGVLSKDSVKARIEKYRTYLEDTGAWDREMATWPEAMNPDPDEEFEYMDEWLDGRYEWMEKRIMEVVYDVPIVKEEDEE